MGKKVDLTGKRFGRILVINQNERRAKNGAIYWNCKCDCGNEKVILGTNLTTGVTVSCGCYNRDVITKENPKYKRSLYYIYKGMIRRCKNKNEKAYKNYGGRGIICEWETYEDFEKWAIDNGYRKGLWIDRINNDGNYSPSNCRFCTPKEQQNNKRTNVFETINGETLTLQQWGDRYGIGRGTIDARHKSGLTGKDLIKPIDKSKSHGKEIKRALREKKNDRKRDI